MRPADYCEACGQPMHDGRCADAARIAELETRLAAAEKVCEAAFKALDDAVAGIRYVEQKEHFYGLGADRVEEKYAEARRLREKLEEGK